MIKERNRTLYVITIMLFMTYLLFLVWCILFKLEFSLKAIETTRAYNLIPFYYENGNNISFHISEIIENVMIFIPAGVYLGLLVKKIHLLGKVALVLSYSLILECLQYALAVGRFDITDLITNVLGGCIGIVFYSIICKAARNKQNTEIALAILVNAFFVTIASSLTVLLLLN